MRNAVLAAAIVLLAVGGPADAAAPVARVGRPAPGFTLKDQDGRTVVLAKLRGRIVVLEWMDSECPSWLRHAKAGTMKTLAERYAPRGVAWFAVSSTPHLPLERDSWVREAFALPYPVLNDRAGRVARVYGAKTAPHMFVIDAKGFLAYAGAIDDDPSGAGAAPVHLVAKALEELLAGKPVGVPGVKPYGCPVKDPRPTNRP